VVNQSGGEPLSRAVIWHDSARGTIPRVRPMASGETYYRASVDLCVRLSSESGHVSVLPPHKHAYKLPIDLLNMGAPRQ
jgi:hypothetical protein